MYTQFFGMTEHPFSIVPNPHFLYMSERHSEALAHLNFGQGEHGGFVLLTGEVGTGKTTVSRRLIKQMPETTELAFILNPALTEVELLATVCDELGIHYDKQNLSLKELFDGISQRLLINHQAAKHTVLLIDEAQHLSLAAMEQLRLLTNLETDARKLLQVILIGQPELQQMLKQNNLRQLAQRITARYHLMPLNIHETQAYIEYRLQVVGVTKVIFTAQAIASVFAASNGIPRLINLICDRALMAAYGLGINKVDVQHVMTGANEVLGLEEKPLSKSRWPWFAAAFIAVFTSLVLLPPGSIFYFLSGYDSPKVDVHNIKVTQPAHSLNQNNIVSLPTPIIEHKASAPEADRQVNKLDDDSRTNDSQVNGTQVNGTQVNDAKVNSAQVDASQIKTAAEGINTKPSHVDAPTSSLNELITQGQNKRSAYVSLFRIWGIELTEKKASCKTAIRVDLSCRHLEVELDTLLQTNSPVVVELSEGNDSWFAVLFEVDSKYHLLVGDHAISVTRLWFEQHWQGKATLFWQPPPNYVGQLMVGGKGRAVQWLESSFAQLEARKARKLSRFDNKLKASVQAFQRKEGLVDDGIAGVQTLIRLRQDLNETLPRLVLNQKIQNTVEDLYSEPKSSDLTTLENVK